MDAFNNMLYNQKLNPKQPVDEKLQNTILKKVQKINEKSLQNLLEQEHGFTIPTFHLTLPKSDDPLMCQIREKSRQLSDYSKTIDLLEHEELEELYDNLEQNSTPPIGNPRSDIYIGYTDYINLLPTLSEKVRKLLNSTVFLKLINPDDKFGRVDITAIFNYALRKTWLRRTRIELDRYDSDGTGLIDDDGLTHYIKYTLVPTKPFLCKIDKRFLPFYICNVVRKFMFFLDPNKTGKVKIIDVLSCSFLDDLYEVGDECITSFNNWFTYQTATRVYATFLEMDTDRSGTLTPAKLINYMKDEINFTQTFINRVFEENFTTSGEMDYATYLDFVLALDHPKERRSIDYMFRILDVRHQGYLDEFTLHYFFQDIKQMCLTDRSWDLSFENVKNEIFDIVKPEDPFKITVPDLIKSGSASRIFSILTDFNGFVSSLNK